MSETPGVPDRVGSSNKSALAQFLDTLVPARYPTDAALARAAGVSRSHVSRWRKGMTPTMPNLYGLARAAGVSVEYLITVVGYEKWSAEQDKDD